MCVWENGEVKELGKCQFFIVIRFSFCFCIFAYLNDFFLGGGWSWKKTYKLIFYVLKFNKMIGILIQISGTDHGTRCFFLFFFSLSYNFLLIHQSYAVAFVVVCFLFWMAYFYYMNFFLCFSSLQIIPKTKWKRTCNVMILLAQI